jgi:hypothetical protein
MALSSHARGPHSDEFTSSVQSAEEPGQAAWRRYGRLARHLAAAWSHSKVPFITVVQTFPASQESDRND